MIGTALAVGATVAGTVIFGIAGAGFAALLPHKSLSMLAAPIFGIVLWPLATLTLYVAIPPASQLTFDQAAKLAFVFLVALNICLLRQEPPTRSWWQCMPVALGICLLVAPAMMFSWVARGEPALLYTVGTDHLGYAHLADWIRSHSPQMLTNAPGGIRIGPAFADPVQPYSSWPNLVLTADPRAASFAYLALVSIFLGQSGMFSYDAAAAILLVSSCLGCAAVFCRRPSIAALAALALLTTLWFDYGRMGFLGKMLSYPNVLLVFGVFVAYREKGASPVSVFMLMLLGAGVGLMHSGIAWALLFASLAIPYLLAASILERKLPTLTDVACAASPAVAAVIAGGALARPLNAAAFPDWNIPWSKLSYILLDLQGINFEVSGSHGLSLSIMAWIGLAIIAIARRNATALALLSGPVFLIFEMYFRGDRAQATQIAGFAYPAAICAAATLLNNETQALTVRTSRLSYAAAACLALLIAVHIPRAYGSLRSYTAHTDQRQMFAKSDFDRLQAAIGDRDVYIDEREYEWQILPILVEMGRRNLHLVWSPHSWRHAVERYRGWPAPAVEHRPPLRLIDATEPPGKDEQMLVETRRYRLLAPAPGHISAP